MSCCGQPSKSREPARKLTPAEHREIAMRGRKVRKPADVNTAKTVLAKFYDGPIIRHLCYHIWPTKNSPAWEWNVEHLLARFDQFNGRKIIGIAVDGRSESAETVMKKFDGRGCEFIVRDNQELGEVVTAPEMLAKVLDKDQNSLVFYAHAKGVKHKQHEFVNRPIRRWADVMYRTLLDDPQAVASALIDNKFAGSFRRKYGSAGRLFHYSGTFYWLRSMHFGKEDAGRISRRYTGMEFWPPKVATFGDTACLFHDNADNLYSNGYWKSSVDPQLEQWEAHQKSLSVIVPCHNYGRYLDECLASIRSQTLQPTEIVVVDDASTDDVRSIAEKHGTTYHRIEASDPHEARRSGFNATTGKHVCFVDADDRLEPDYLASAMESLSKSNATIAYSDIQHFGDDESIREHRGGDIRLGNYIHGGSVCRRDALKASGVMDNALPDARNRYSDWWLWRHALMCGGSAVWHPVKYLYRKHGNSLSDRRTVVAESYRHCRDLLGFQ